MAEKFVGNWSVTEMKDFSEYADRWDAVNRSGPSSPVLESDFIAPLVENFANGSLWMAELRQGGVEIPDAMLILEPRGMGRWGTFQPSQAPIGLCVSTTREDQARLGESLLSSLPGFAIMLDVTQLDPHLYQRPQASGVVHTLEYIPTSRILVEGDHDQFWKARSRNTRQNLKRQRNRLDREGITPRLEKITEPAEMRRVIEDYGRIEASGWKGNTGTAVSMENAQGSFYLSVMERFARRHRAVAYRYWYNDDLAAMDLCIHNGRVVVILKTTYNEKIKASSPAMLMHQEIFASIFDERPFEVIEFYGRTLDWHRKWTRDERSLYHMSIYRNGLLKFLHRNLPGRARAGDSSAD